MMGVSSALRISHRRLRQAMFSTYVLLTVLFCLFLVHLGRLEVAKAAAFAEHEHVYLERLAEVRAGLDAVEDALAGLTPDPSPGSVAAFGEEARRFRGAVNQLATMDQRRELPRDPVQPMPQTEALMIHTLAAALAVDVAAPSPERSLLLEQDLRALREALRAARGMLQQQLRTEIAQGDRWLRQSRFFFSRLQYLLILFFILTTCFTVIAAFAVGDNLRRSLRRLSQGAAEVSAGNLGYRFDGIESDEIGGVMYDFNRMARRLEQQTEALQQVNREVEAKAAELAEAHKSKDRFLANMSHELRTPLNSIIGFSELIVRKAGETPEAERFSQYAERILSGAEHLLDLISDLLEVAKVDAGVLKPVIRDVNLAACVTRVEQMLRPLAEHKGLAFSVDPVPDGLTLAVDDRLLRQVLINLVNNAIKYTPAGRVAVHVDADADECRIAIADTGIGLSEADQRLIFRDFHRVEQGLTSNYEGVGLGLTLSKRIVELHGGQIIVRSEPGQGSVFTVILPRRQPPDERNPAP
jgi:signal transduction histidine kinase